MHLVEDEVEDEGEEVEQPARPQHPPRDPGRDEAGLSSIDNGLGAIQGRAGDASASLLIILNIFHGHGRTDCQSSSILNIKSQSSAINSNKHNEF